MYDTMGTFAMATAFLDRLLQMKVDFQLTLGEEEEEWRMGVDKTEFNILLDKFFVWHKRFLCSNVFTVTNNKGGTSDACRPINLVSMKHLEDGDSMEFTVILSMMGILFRVSGCNIQHRAAMIKSAIQRTMLFEYTHSIEIFDLEKYINYMFQRF